MEPISIISLVVTCTAIATKLVTIIKSLNNIVAKTDRSAARLAAQLRLFGATVNQLQQWLNKGTAISTGLKATMQLSLQSCTGIITDIDEHVNRVMLPTGGVGAIGKARHHWDGKTIQEYERMLATQFQAFDLLIRLLTLNDPKDQDSLLEGATSQSVFQQSEKDARTVKRTAASTLSSDLLSGNTSLQFEFDEGLVGTGPYLKHYRDMVRERKASSSEGTEPKPKSTRGALGSPSLRSTGSGKQTFMGATVIKPLAALLQKNSADTKLAFSQLCQASRDGHVEWALALVEEGADMNGVDDRRLTPMFYATSAGHLPIVELLFDRGAEINACSGRSSALLATAVQRGHVDIARFLLNNGADFNSGCFDGTSLKSPLHHAIVQGHVDIARLLLEHGASVEEGERGRLSPLCSAAARGRRDMIQLLLEHGAQVNRSDNQADWGTGFSALHVAARAGVREIVEDVLAAGADIKATCQQRSGTSGVTALHLAKGACAETLIQAGSKVFARDSSGQVPLAAAVRSGDLDAVRANLRHKAPVNADDKKKDTALHVACKSFTDPTVRDPEVLGIYVEIVRDLLQAEPSAGVRRACRSILIGRYKKIAGGSRDSSANKLDILDLMEKVFESAKEEAAKGTSSSGARDTPHGPFGESFLAIMATKPFKKG